MNAFAFIIGKFQARIGGIIHMAERERHNLTFIGKNVSYQSQIRIIDVDLSRARSAEGLRLIGIIAFQADDIAVFDGDSVIGLTI